MNTRRLPTDGSVRYALGRYLRFARRMAQRYRVAGQYEGAVSWNGAARELRQALWIARQIDAAQMAAVKGSDPRD